MYLTGGDQGKMLQIPGPPARLLTLSHTHCRCVPVLLLIPRVHLVPKFTHTHYVDNFIYFYIKKNVQYTCVHVFQSHPHK